MPFPLQSPWRMFPQRPLGWKAGVSTFIKQGSHFYGVGPIPPQHTKQKHSVSSEKLDFEKKIFFPGAALVHADIQKAEYEDYWFAHREDDGDQ